MCTKTWKIKLAIPGVTSQKLCYDFITWYHTPRLIQLFLIHFINIYLSDGFIIGKFYYFISFSIYIFIIIYSFSFFFSHIPLRSLKLGQLKFSHINPCISLHLKNIVTAVVAFEIFTRF
uniref:Uncharacterized protein n=1 Tax=Cacopsylla melanoneura TaxID=428564 RepID=A0A8D9BJC8_9HEMI